LTVFMLILVLILIGPFLWRVDPGFVELRMRNKGFSGAHPLGT